MLISTQSSPECIGRRVTWFAKSAPVVYRQPQFWEKSEWLYVVGIETNASFATPHACPIVSLENSLPPQAILLRVSYCFVDGRYASLPVWTFGAFLVRCTHFHASLERMLRALLFESDCDLRCLGVFVSKMSISGCLGSPGFRGIVHNFLFSASGSYPSAIRSCRPYF